jgi:hypothetical protein
MAIPRFQMDHHRSPISLSIDEGRRKEDHKVGEGARKGQDTLHFTDGTTSTEAFLAHKPKMQLRGNLATQLGVETNPQGTIKVNPPLK